MKDFGEALNKPMTDDWAERKAGEYAKNLHKADLLWPQEWIEVARHLAQALRDTRNDALEQAELVALRWRDFADRDTEYAAGCRAHAQKIADGIRALKDKADGS